MDGGVFMVLFGLFAATGGILYLAIGMSRDYKEPKNKVNV